MAIEWEKEVMDVLGNERFMLDEATRSRLSKDYYWYSPVLDELLKDKIADGIAIPATEEDVQLILKLAYKYKIAVTIRGGGTGNYGQAVPLEGGIVLDLSRLNEIVEIGVDYVRVQCGTKLGVLERKLRENGRELCCYPSTYVKATVGGFVAGGSGGIGSITWGTLWDGNVLGATVYSLEDKPRKIEVDGQELYNYIHSYGTVGIITELKIRTAPKIEWEQNIVQFNTLELAMAFSENLGKDDSIPKRELSVMEWPVPSYFTPFKDYLEDEKHVVLIESAEEVNEDLSEMISSYHGQIKHTIGADQYHKTLGLSDFTWNHTTLWALKTDPTLTYLQARFSPEKYMQQIQQVKDRFPGEVQLHFEWIKSGGVLTPASLPVIRYESEQRLYEIIDFMNGIDIVVIDPHTFVLNTNVRAQGAGMIGCKKINDPLGLLNPGKINV